MADQGDREGIQSGGIQRGIHLSGWSGNKALSEQCARAKGNRLRAATSSGGRGKVTTNARAKDDDARLIWQMISGNQRGRHHGRIR